LHGIPHRVYWIRKIRTIQVDCPRAIIYDGNTSSTAPAQREVVEGDFDDVSTGNCDIPGTPAVLREVVWKIGTGKEPT